MATGRPLGAGQGEGTGLYFVPRAAEGWVGKSGLPCAPQPPSIPHHCLALHEYTALHLCASPTGGGAPLNRHLGGSAVAWPLVMQTPLVLKGPPDRQRLGRGTPLSHPMLQPRSPTPPGEDDQCSHGPCTGSPSFLGRLAGWWQFIGGQEVPFA